MKRIIISAVLTAITVLLASCGMAKTATAERTSIAGGTEDFDYYVSILSDTDKKTSFDSEATVVTLNGDSAHIDGDGATFEDGKLSITVGGDYVISGVLKDGMIYVNAPEGKVHIVLDGVTLTSKSEAAIFVEDADKVVITAKDGTDNKITQSVKTTGQTEQKAAIYAKDDLTINGSGSLTVIGTAKNGITCKNDLRIVGATVTVTAVNNGIKADDSMIITGSTMTVTADNDGIKVSNDEETDEGYLAVIGGSYTVVAGDDALQADRLIVVRACSIETHAEGKATNAPTKEVESGTVVKK